VLLIVVVSTIFLLTIGRKAIDLAFQFANKKLSKPGAELSLAILLCFAGGIFTEWLGIKAIFGAFLMGIAIGDSKNFNLGTVLFILAISIIGKLLGGFIGARLSGFKTHKAFAVGFGMNARGSQEIVLGLVALQARIIDERIFVGLLVMTFVTILVAGPAIKYFLRKHDAS